MTGFKHTFATPLTETSSSDKEGVGAIRVQKNRVYKWVKFVANGVQAVVGNLAYYNGSAGYGNHEVTGHRASGVVAAGVFVSVPADGEYCWVQIKGPVTANQAIGGTPSAGDPLTMSSTNGAFTRAAESDSTAVYKQVVGYVVHVANKQVVLDLPF